MADSAGDDGFDEWFVERYPDARRVAHRVLGSAVAAEDAAAEAFTRALADWTRVSALPHRDAWVLRVTSNVAVDAARRRRPDPVVDHAGDDMDDVAVLRVSLVAALARLPRRQREAICLRYLAGLPADEVAEAMGVSANSAKKHLQRGLDRLRRSAPDDLGVDHVIA